MSVERALTKAGVPIFGMLAGILADYQAWGSAVAAFVIFAACVISLIET